MKKIIFMFLLLVFITNNCSTPEKRSFGAPNASKVTSKTVVLIHGMFLTPISWENWKLKLEQNGYKVIAPAWPYHDKSVMEQRQNHPDAKLGALTLEEVLIIYRTEISKLKEKPILIGHSMGGLIVQKLMEENLGEAGIALHSAPTKGLISLKFSFLKSNWAVISPFANKKEAFFPNIEQFSYAFLNALPEEKRKENYEKYAVPESRLVGNAPTMDVADVNFSKKQAPLLFLAGQLDQIIPDSLNYKNFQKYDDNPSLTDFQNLPNKSHWVLLEPNWEESFDVALKWLNSLR